ncbi:MAG TPA: DUF1501 domain-containing protein [Chthoniobacteraceae bacterium]|jgi:hypothetical protein|nr:DUF1501 domain-containing protein [Chthoniobacteraceae bacterium]
MNDRPYECRSVTPAMLTRRDLLRTVSAGFGWLAFKSLTTAASAAENRHPLAEKAPHFPPRAKRVIFLCMQGGPSHIDTFDYKPKLNEDSGKPGPSRGGGSKLYGSPFKFEQRGESGLWISELFPKVAEHADDLCLLRGMHTDIPNHPQAFVQLHTGSSQFVRPSLGAWALYGLGTANENLPGFVTISPPIQFGAQNYGSAFLPASYQGTRLGAQRGDNGTATVGNMRNPDLSTVQQRKQIDLVQSMNQDLLATTANPEVEGVIESYELAFRMQGELPKVLDVTKESRETLAAYGVGSGVGGEFGKQCLMARRLVEAGVRFVEVCHAGWDQHQSLQSKLRQNCAATDQGIGALLGDLKARGLLEDTLVIWGGEFGRTPDGRRDDGRDHNAKGFTMWMAGGGVKGGLSYGATDDYGAQAVEDKVHTHDLHATILALLGLDHEKLTYRYAGRDFRLTDVHGTVAKAIFA